MSDTNIWAALFCDDPLGERAWLASLGFEEGTLVPGDDERSVRHSEMIWPEGGRVMVSSKPAQEGDDYFSVAFGAIALYVVTDRPDEVHERALALGAKVLRPLEDADYGSRGFSIADPEGNRISFGTYAGEE